jgi:REP element-mobilizing transposase RayT
MLCATFACIVAGIGAGASSPHMRTNHVHVVVEAEVRPETIMNTFKSYASRDLNRPGHDAPDQKRWARHGGMRWGGTRRLWKDHYGQEAIRYVVSRQGDPIEVYLRDQL